MAEYLAIATAPSSLATIGTAASMGLAYVSLFSMFLGFVVWYAGLAQGGTASTGQLQLPQPFLCFVRAALFPGETVTWQMLAATAGIPTLVTAGRRSA